MQPTNAPEGREHTIHVAENDRPPRALDLGEYVDTRNADGLLSFSPDGKRLAFHVGFMEMGALPHPRVGVVDLESGAVVFVHRETYSSRGHGDSRHESGPTAWAAWDGAGRRFAFVGSEGPDRRTVFTAAADGSDLRPHTLEQGWKGGACLSPEGERCAYWIHVDRQETDKPEGLAAWLGYGLANGLRVLQLHTGESVEIPVPAEGNGTDLQWSPDGRHLWFGWSGAEGWGVYRAAVPPPAVVPEGTPFVDRRRGPVDEAVEALRTDDRHAIEKTLEELDDVDDPRLTRALLDVLARSLRKSEGQLPWHLLDALVRRGVAGLIPLLLEALSAKRHVRSATSFLLSLDIEEAVPYWRALLGAGEEDRGAAMVGLARYGGEPEWAQLREALAGDRRDLREVIVGLLGFVPDPRSVDLLIPLVADPMFLYTAERSVVLGDHVRASLRRLTGQQLGQDPAAWAAWWASVNRRLSPSRAQR